MATPATILIVDDDEGSRELVVFALEGNGYRLLVAETGADALALARSHLPDLVLLDVMMPGMDGYEVCRSLRHTMRTAEMPIVMITALDDRESRLHGIEAGADDFLSKPVDRIELRARVRTITRLNRYRRLLEDQARLEAAAVELKMAYDSTLEGWARALELRDHETEGHSRRVTEMTVRLARTLGISEADLVHIRRGALLHDIGKIGIPDRILLKPGKLDADEWEEMKRHTIYARDLLMPVTFLHPAMDIPYCHHERWDGSGYPQGLSGEEIPIAARIFAVIDVWDAVTHDRPYHRARTPAETMELIRNDTGSHFDPCVVKAFLQMMEEASDSEALASAPS
ncbi:MAG: response regulator [Chloroflexales bacterium]|nr:response regulator [Chloroflexales bacterium]